MNLNIHNERQDCKMCTACGVLVGEELNEGDEGEGIWRMDFTYAMN
jgi:hypothetical protein